MTTVSSTADRDSTEVLGGRWRLDPRRSSVEFRAKHLWGLQTVEGHFDRYDGHLDLSAHPAVDLTIAAASLETGNRKRDKHLRSADFFDVEHHPQVRFISTSVEPHGDALRVTGRLSAGGRSIPLEVSAWIHEDEGELELEAIATVPQGELGMTYSPLRMIRPRSELIVRGHLTPSD
jgi:polyisoprenoid-binding protein YceI